MGKEEKDTGVAAAGDAAHRWARLTSSASDAARTPWRPCPRRDADAGEAGADAADGHDPVILHRVRVRVLLEAAWVAAWPAPRAFAHPRGPRDAPPQYRGAIAAEPNGTSTPWTKKPKQQMKKKKKKVWETWKQRRKQRSSEGSSEEGKGRVAHPMW